jgi:multiple sugar transport system substrate-binding protein
MALAGCTNLPFGLGGGNQITPTPVSDTQPPSPTPADVGTQTQAIPSLTETASPPDNQSVLRIWVSPEFDPDADNPASQLLKARLEGFVSENPDLNLEVRVKASDGEGGMLESLVAANVAAPSAVPDLVLLSRPLLESATLKGVLYPFDGLTELMNDPNWYDYARQQSQIQSSTYGIPFAGDGLVLAFRQTLTETQTSNLEVLLSLGEPLLYPAADPQALFTLSLYLATNSSVQDAQGRPSLDKDALISIFEFDQQASQVGVMPYGLTQYTNDAQVWEAFTNIQYPMAITWASTFLTHQISTSDNLALSAAPTMRGVPFTLATGWSWALPNQDPERRSTAVRLVEYLVDREFMAQWTYTAGYLPPRKDVLQGWREMGLSDTLDSISSSAVLVPSVDILSSLGPPLEQALVSVLRAQSDPQTAAQAVISQISKP